MEPTTTGQPPSASPPVTVSTLIGHRDVMMGLDCLGSMKRCSADPLRFEIHEDGTLTPDDREMLVDLLPVAGFMDRREADERMVARLQKYPACLAYRSRHVLGLKLFDVPLLSKTDDVAFCDSDIFFFRRFRNLFAWPDAKTGCLFMQDWQDAYALRPWHLWELKMPKRLNSGLYFLRRDLFDLDFLEWLLSRDYQVFWRLAFWVEQTCWAALASRINGQFWGRRQILAIEREADLQKDLIAGHFTSSVRSLLPKGREKMQMDRPIEPLRVERMGDLYASQLLAQQMARMVRRTIWRWKAAREAERE